MTRDDERMGTVILTAEAVRHGDISALDVG